MRIAETWQALAHVATRDDNDPTDDPVDSGGSLHHVPAMPVNIRQPRLLTVTWTTRWGQVKTRTFNLVGSHSVSMGKGSPPLKTEVLFMPPGRPFPLTKIRLERIVRVVDEDGNEVQRTAEAMMQASLTE